MVNFNNCEKCDIDLEVHDELWCLAHQQRNITEKLLESTLRMSSERQHLKAEIASLKDQIAFLSSINDALLKQIRDPRNSSVAI
jgi:hypothetical protein